MKASDKAETRVPDRMAFLCGGLRAQFQFPSGELSEPWGSRMTFDEQDQPCSSDETSPTPPHSPS